MNLRMETNNSRLELTLCVALSPYIILIASVHIIDCQFFMKTATPFRDYLFPLQQKISLQADVSWNVAINLRKKFKNSSSIYDTITCFFHCDLK